MRLSSFIKNLVKSVLLSIIFCACLTSIYAQSGSTSVYVSFSKSCLSKYGLAGLGGSDTLCFNNDLPELLKSNGFQNIRINESGSLESVINVDSSEQYKYKYRNGKLIEEEAYLLSPEILFRKRFFFYDKKGRLTHIEYKYNLCCESQSPIPPDNVFYQYDTKGYLKFVLIAISSRKNKDKDYVDRGNPIRKGKDFTKVYAISYLSNEIEINSYSLNGKYLTEIKAYDFNRVISGAQEETKYTIRTDKVNFKQLKQSFPSIIFPAY